MKVWTLPLLSGKRCEHYSCWVKRYMNTTRDVNASLAEWKEMWTLIWVRKGEKKDTDAKSPLTLNPSAQTYTQRTVLVKTKAHLECCEKTACTTLHRLTKHTALPHLAHSTFSPSTLHPSPFLPKDLSCVTCRLSFVMGLSSLASSPGMYVLCLQLQKGWCLFKKPAWSFLHQDSHPWVLAEVPDCTDGENSTCQSYGTEEMCAHVQTWNHRQQDLGDAYWWWPGDHAVETRRYHAHSESSSPIADQKCRLAICLFFRFHSAAFVLFCPSLTQIMYLRTEWKWVKNEVNENGFIVYVLKKN